MLIMELRLGVRREQKRQNERALGHSENGDVYFVGNGKGQGCSLM